MSETKDPRIAALLREREGYERYGRTDRVKAVDAELERLGHSEKPTKKAAPTRATRESKQTTADSKKAAEKS